MKHVLLQPVSTQGKAFRAGAPVKELSRHNRAVKACLEPHLHKGGRCTHAMLPDHYLSEDHTAKPAAGESEADNWWDEAACSGEPLHVFFTPGSGAVSNGYWDRAEELCATCPVKRSCLIDAMKSEATTPGRNHGFVGGLHASEREALQRKWRRQGWRPGPLKRRKKADYWE